MKQSNGAQKLNVVARAPFNIYYEGEAEVVTATNKVGTFDVLPGHADFFSILSAGEVIIDASPSPIGFNINNGIITVRDDQVFLFVNI